MINDRQRPDEFDEFIDILALKQPDISTSTSEGDLNQFTQSFEKLSLQTNPNEPSLDPSITFDTLQTSLIDLQAMLLMSNFKQPITQPSPENQSLNTFSRIVQNLYVKATPTQKEQIFLLVFPFFSHYVLDKYNHYILEKILEAGLIHHQVQVLELLVKCLPLLVFDTYGSKVVQKAVEISQKSFPLYLQQFTSFVTSSVEVLRRLCVDKIGTQLIQKCLDVLEDEDLSSLVSMLRTIILPGPNSRKAGRVQEICTNQYGCLVVNKIIDIFPKQIDPNNRQLVDDLIRDIIRIQSFLSRRQYSNFIIQQILLKGQSVHKEALLNEQIFEDFVSMAMDKYGSNIAEKSIVYGSPAFRSRVWTDKISISEQDFLRLFNDQFGNYVVQRVYDHADVQTKSLIWNIVQFMNNNFRLSNYGLIAMKYIEKQGKQLSQMVSEQMSRYAQQNVQYQVMNTQDFRNSGHNDYYHNPPQSNERYVPASNHYVKKNAKKYYKNN